MAPLNEVTTRTGSITVGDKVVTVFQYGRRMRLMPDHAEVGYGEYGAEVVPVTVDALKITEWNVTVNASWLSVVNTPKGKGGDSLLIAAGKNPSSRARSGTVTIGTETFTVTQAGSKELSLEVAPVETTASINGANGHIAVTATPDLPWAATSQSSWLVLLASSASGAGNGNVFYTASPNTSLESRTGTITVTPADGSLPAKVHTVTQPAARADLSFSGYEFDAPGGTVSVDVTVADRVQWSVSESASWVTVLDGLSYMGSNSVRIQVDENPTTVPRSAVVSIAGTAFAVSQKGRGVSLEFEEADTLFGFDGGWGVIGIYPDGDIEWTATVSDPNFITLMGETSGMGSSALTFSVPGYNGDGSPMTGWIDIGGQRITITQRPYELDIEPKASEVSGNNGAGEISVSADIGAIWSVLECSPWIKINSSNGMGDGQIFFEYEANDTGRTREGWINISGTIYTITQAARVTVNIAVTLDGHGTVDGAGVHSLGERVTLTAIPDAGYEFDYWTTPDGENMQNPINVTADVAKSFTAKFSPLTPDLLAAESTTEGPVITWKSLEWASEYRVYRAPTSEFPPVPLATLTSGGECIYQDVSAELEKTYWYWIEAVGIDDTTLAQNPKTAKKRKAIVFSAISYVNLRGATHSNPATYQEETSVSFSAPSAVTGYTFSGWTPAMITADMTGPQTVSATWRANTYTIAYSANGGVGSMDAAMCEYDEIVEIAENGFSCTGCAFLGWAVAPDGDVVYQPGEAVSNLTAEAEGVVTLYAVWELLDVAAPIITPADGTSFKSDTCTVTITCATPGAVIYYTTNGRTPRPIPANIYSGPFTISETATIVALAVNGSKESEYSEATITKAEREELTFANALEEPKIGSYDTSLDAPWTPVYDETRVADGMSVKSGVVGNEQSSYLEVTVYGSGTLTFWWKTNCEQDPRGRYDYDHLSVSIDNEVADCLDGQSLWIKKSYEIPTDGPHTICWTYETDDFEEFVGCAWIDGVTWSGAAASSSDIVVNDPDGVITLPEGKDISELSVKVMRNGYDIFPYLKLPAAQGGVIDLSQASVKDEIIAETLDTAKGAAITLNADSPVITTAPTRPGLTYTLREGTEVRSLSDGASKTGDGQPWTPPITVKGGTSGFYTIRVTK